MVAVIGLTACGGRQAGEPISPAGRQPAGQASQVAISSHASGPTIAAPSDTPWPVVTATNTPAPTETPTVVVLVGAGDIAACGAPGAEITARLVEQVLKASGQAPGVAVFTTGDNTNELTTDPASLEPCFDQTWGRFKELIHPALGNHEYFFSGAADYFAYFGAAAGTPGQGWYSYDLGDWHIMVLNSECNKVGGCQAGSPQETWLKVDLAAHPARCSLAIWHRPRFSSGYHGSSPARQDLWNDLYVAGTEMLISGHDHDYERFAPMDAQGGLDPVHGITQFVVGTGGVPEAGAIRPVLADNSRVVITGVYGVLELSLRPDGYDWAFVAEPGKTEGDRGSGECH